jgi:hypothetical protein
MLTPRPRREHVFRTALFWPFHLRTPNSRAAIAQIDKGQKNYLAEISAKFVGGVSDADIAQLRLRLIAGNPKSRSETAPTKLSSKLSGGELRQPAFEKTPFRLLLCE